MTFKELSDINSHLKTVEVKKGKPYVMVHERVKGFRQLYPDGTIETELINMEEGSVTVKATVRNAEGRVLSTGLAHEKEGDSYINKASAVENCETGAVGRALGFLGIGIDSAIAAAEELVQAAVRQQNESKLAEMQSVDEIRQRLYDQIYVECDRTGVPEEKIFRSYKRHDGSPKVSLEELSNDELLNAAGRLKKTKSKEELE